MKNERKEPTPSPPQKNQAFPICADSIIYDRGMSLRDYFAAHASDEDIRQLQSLKPEGYISTQCARYMHADAMLKAREDVKE